MKQKDPPLPTSVTAPKAAAIAGIVFSILLIISFILFLTSLPANLQDEGRWLSTQGNTILLGLNLVPFAGIAFLWFMGVVRDRLRSHEDRFISTVFIGSGLLFLALLFSVAALTGAIVLLYQSQADPSVTSNFYNFSQLLTSGILNTYMLKMAGVFMMSTSTLFLRAKAIPKWMGFLGYGLAAIMLLRISHLDRLGWVSLSFPLWVLLISIYLLMDSYRRKPDFPTP
ncbi:hypothetical protein C7B76_16655 [filamentous cyanobacterium CCP2]|nr:hypothetical protein C7B76_16655 [filamentous cyanobacterium CCP2]